MKAHEDRLQPGSGETTDQGAGLAAVENNTTVVPADQLPHAVRVRDGWRGLAAWMRAEGTIDREDAIDCCARAVENYAEYQFKLATEQIPDVEATEPRLTGVTLHQAATIMAFNKEEATRQYQRAERAEALLRERIDINTLVIREQHDKAHADWYGRVYDYLQTLVGSHGNQGSTPSSGSAQSAALKSSFCKSW